MGDFRSVNKVFTGKPTLEGAGVRLHRVFGFNEVPLFDPFLMLDDFGSAEPDDYTAGFPWHPHRGIKTVTYMLHGSVAHGDSLGNSGVIRDGQIQWMTAGGGIIHQEMPERQPDYLRGLQLWVNLPGRDKMMVPRYRDIARDACPTVQTKTGAEVRVIAGRFGNARGPVKDIVIDPGYIDVRVPAGARFEHEIPENHKVFAYVLDGSGCFDAGQDPLPQGRLALYGPGRAVSVTAGKDGVRFVLISGRPLGEPVAWGGPIVMNTQAELDQAFREYQAGTFIKKPAPSAGGTRS
jgi:redox-sensitive bicupin YhaK (pirin superfamily)